MKQVIHIFGPSGGGTSTLGRKICDELGFRFMDTDDYFWEATNPKFTVKRPVDQRLAMMRLDIDASENVVISGSLTDWGDPLIPLFTLAVRVETASEVRLERLRKREKAAYGSRIEPGGDMYQIHTAFLEWAMAYDTGGPDMRSKAKHDEWQTLLTCPLIELNGADDLNANFAKVRRLLQ